MQQPRRKPAASGNAERRAGTGSSPPRTSPEAPSVVTAPPRGGSPQSTASTLPDELSLARLWESGRLPRELHSTDGEPVEVIYRGRWSHGYGPDFRDALIAVGGRLSRGAVELHVRASGWRAHGHGANPLYDDVVLHVVWLADAPVDVSAPTLELAGYVDADDLRDLPVPGRLDGDPCAVFATRASAERAVALIERAGDERFGARCDMFEGELAARPAEDVLYGGLMEAMGYAENKLPFRLLSEQLPYDAVRDPDAARVADRLCASSGLLPDTPGLLARTQWNLARLRPANHPLRRMAGLAQVVARAEARGGLVPYLVTDGIQQDPDVLRDRLRAINQEGETLIGPDRAGEALVNVVLPLAVALARTNGDAALEVAALDRWRTLPRASATRVERSMRAHLQLPRGSRLLDRAHHQQGLLHLYKRYCAQRLCSACPLARLASPREQGPGCR